MSMTNCGYQLRKVSGPEIEPVSLEDARRQLKIDADITGDDPLIENVWIPAAREAVEDYCGITLCETQYILSLEDFPRSGDGRLVLPRGPVIAILGITYVGNDGVRVPVTDQWNEGGLADVPPWIGSVYGGCWPSGRVAAGSVQVEYRAGYPGAGSPPDAHSVPKRAIQTILSICTRWYEKREMVDVDDLLYGGVWPLRRLT